MNRRGLLKGVLAIPIVAALAPLLPKSVSRVWTSPDIDMGLPVRPPRFLRYRITWLGNKVVFNERAIARLQSFSEYSEPLAVDGGPWRSAEDHVTVYPLVSGLTPNNNYDIAVEASDDGKKWAPAPADRIKVVLLK